MGEALNLLNAKRKLILADISETRNLLKANNKFTVRLKNHLLEADKRLRAINDEIITHQKGGK